MSVVVITAIQCDRCPQGPVDQEPAAVHVAQRNTRCLRRARAIARETGWIHHHPDVDICPACQERDKVTLEK